MTTTGVNPLRYLVRAVWVHARARRGRFLFYLVLSLSAIAVHTAEPLVLAALVNLLQHAPSLDAVLMQALGYVLIFGVLQAAFWALQGYSRIVMREVAYEVRADYQLQLFRTAVALPIAWHRNNHAGETIDRIARASNALNDFLDSSFEIMHLSARFLASIAILCVFLPAAGIGVAIVSALVMYVTVLFSRRLFAQDQVLNGYFRSAAAAVHDFLSNFSTVISLRLQERASAEVWRRLRACLPVFIANVRLNELKWFVTLFAVTLTTVTVLAIYLYDVSRSGAAFQAGTFLALFEYLRRIGDGFGAFAFKYEHLVANASKVRSAEELRDSFRALVSEAADVHLPDTWQRLRIRDLRFSFEDGGQSGGVVLRDMEFVLQRGAKIALVGASGSGKSTLLSLFRALRTPQSATVDCDGVVLPHGLAHIAATTTLIPQDAEIFAESIRFNVALGVAADDVQILEAIQLAQFSSVLSGLPCGLDTNIAEKGVNLSGGERQRLALARGVFFAGDSTIVLLDEPTSSVDASNEYLIYRQLLERFQQSCVLTALHKLHLLPMFDYIYVFHGGTIVERGSYGELCALDGVLAAMIRNYERHSMGVQPQALAT